MSEEFTAKVKCDLDAAILRFKHHYGVEMPKVIHETMRGLIKTWMQFTPPRTRIMGVRAIRNDFNKKYVATSWFAKNFISRKGSAEQTRIRRYFREKDFTKLKAVQDDGGLFQRLSFVPFSKGQIQRNSRGRIIKTREHIVCTTPEALDAYRKSKEERVGRLKGSMVNALQHFGGNAPDWIKKNAEGSYDDYSKATDIQGASATSFVPYGLQVAQRTDSLRRVYQAMQHKVEGSIAKNVLNKSVRAYYGI